LLNVAVCCTSLASQVLLKGHKKLVTKSEIGAVGRVVRIFRVVAP